MHFSISWLKQEEKIQRQSEKNDDIPFSFTPII